jgi:copper chaperone NosL
MKYSGNDMVKAGGKILTTGPETIVNENEGEVSRPRFSGKFDMKTLPRILFITGSLMLLLVFTAPIWRITLEAPQYPDGVTLYIWINKLEGKTKGTLQNINILNHYVGMKEINPESIPELKYFPIVIIVMSVLGVFAGFLNNHKLWLSWVLLLVILGVLGIYAFYLWEYDYGHNLAEDAPIKVPGMVYQPPLIGSKKLLNFNAISYPHFGSMFLLFSIILGSLAWYLKRKKENANE